jgi:hypothetical protein
LRASPPPSASVPSQHVEAGSRADRGRASAPQKADQAPPAEADGPHASSSGRRRAAEEAFWRLIAETRREAGNDTEQQAELLEARLEELPAAEIAAFDRLRRRLDAEAYTWDLWGAAYVIEDGCSEDCFRMFRSYLISLGREPYEAGLRNPDSLASVVEDSETGNWESALDDAASEAYERVAGVELPGDDVELSGEPSGRPWDDDHEEALVERYPNLADRFR